MLEVPIHLTFSCSKSTIETLGKGICSKLTIKTPEQHLVFLLVTLNIFQTFF